MLQEVLDGSVHLQRDVGSSDLADRQPERQADHCPRRGNHRINACRVRPLDVRRWFDRRLPVSIPYGEMPRTQAGQRLVGLSDGLCRLSNGLPCRTSDGADFLMVYLADFLMVPLANYLMVYLADFRIVSLADFLKVYLAECLMALTF